MTTPPLSGQPHPPPRPGIVPVPPPPPPVPPRARRTVRAALLTALVLLLAAGAGAAWWPARGRQEAPLADRPRVTDTSAGLSYALPSGWVREDGDPARRELPAAFTSRITTDPRRGDGSGHGTVLGGRPGQVVPPSDLRVYAEAAARSHAEFFFPDRTAGPSESRATTVGGHPAHTVTLRVRGTREEGPARLRMILVTVDSDRTSFVLGIAAGGSPAGAQDVDAVLAGADTL
ncbi:hypothetical protein [Streptomyces albus]|uniref:hypothetical protein n=1 Tax=unclassified Streptomyces TaxID=2593676 RepID=UPI000ACE6B0F|nr:MULTISPECIES: hypothetical protein [unclassified Streptomyces]